MFLISVGVLPSNLGPPEITLPLTVDFTKDLNADLIAPVLSSSESKNFSTTSASRDF